MSDIDPSHVTRFSDSSFHDFICINCHHGDGIGVPGAPSKLSLPCTKPVGQGGITLEEWEKNRAPAA